MEIIIRADSVEIEGYVNAIERKSKPLYSRMGNFVEKICKGAFKRALSRGEDVRILLNHDPRRDLGGISNGNLSLEEDAIGLKARATITDADVIEKARRGDLIGWSFGFLDRDVERKTDENGMPLRNVRDLDLKEVSILDRTKSPAYDGTLVAVRSESESLFISENFTDEIKIREEEKPEEKAEEKDSVQVETPVKNINYDEFEQLIADMKK